jgi:hypothetical protein
MGDVLKIWRVEVSRRSLLRSFALTAGGAGMVGTGVGGSRAAAAQTKMTQLLVAYQTTPKGDQRCDNCTQFLPPASCKLVEGTIAASGWCKIYEKKPA